MKTKNWAFLVTGLLIFSHAAMALGLYLALRHDIPAAVEPIVNRRFAGPWLVCLDNLMHTEQRVEEVETANLWLTEQVIDLRTALNHDFSLLDGKERIRQLTKSSSPGPQKPPPTPGGEKKTVAKK